MDEIRDASPSYSGVVPVVARLFNEETTVEREIIEHLQLPELGWTYRSREQVTKLRPDEREVLLLPLLRERLKQLNPTVLTDEARVDAIITKLRTCRDNQQWLTWLRDGVNYKFDPAENAQDVWLIDADIVIHKHVGHSDTVRSLIKPLQDLKEEIFRFCRLLKLTLVEAGVTAIAEDREADHDKTFLEELHCYTAWVTVTFRVRIE